MIPGVIAAHRGRIVSLVLITQKRLQQLISIQNDYKRTGRAGSLQRERATE